MEEKVNFKKNFIWNILGTGFNSFNSLFFMIIVTRVNQIEKAGIFTLAFSTACILYIIGTYAGRIYQVTDNNKNITDKDYLVNRIISCSAMMIVTILFVIIRGYDFYKITIFLLLAFFKCIEAFSDCIYGIFQKNEQLYKVGQSYFIKSLLSLIVFYIVDKCTEDLIISIASIIGIWIIVTFFFDILSAKKLINKNDKVSFKNIMILFKKSFPIFLISFLGLYILNAPKYSIDSYLTEYYQTMFGIIVMPATAVGLFGQFIIHPYLTTIADLYNNKKYKEFKKIVNKIILIILVFGLLATLGAYLLGVPVLNLLYGKDISAFRISLCIIIISATFYIMGFFFSNALTTMRKLFIQAFLYIIIAITALIVSNALTKNIGIDGSVYAYGIIMFTSFILYIVAYFVLIRKEEKKYE